MMDSIQKIYQRLGDGLSREIYAGRLLFSLTGDRKYMTGIIQNTALYQEIYTVLKHDKREKYIAGAGQWGRIIADLFREFGFSGMIDNYARGSYRNLPILTMDEFAKIKEGKTVYIASTSFHEEFCQMLEKIGIGQDQIVDVTGKMLEVYHRQQYFDLPCLAERKEEREIFVDGGCYDAANARMFAEWAGSAGEMIYAFEPDEKNIERCRQALDGIKGISCKLIQKGLWSENGVLNFCADANEGSRLAESGDASISVASLDSAIEGNVTFIKMDIEGAEYEALKGAENLIRRHKPKLAVSVYHNLEDIWKLPELILSICPEYTFYLRHYSLSSEETVLYAL